MKKKNLIFTTKGGKEFRIHTDNIPNGLEGEEVRDILNKKYQGTEYEVIQTTELDDEELVGDTFIDLPDDFGALTEEEKKPELSPLMKQWVELKAKHPDALLLFRCGDFYETYCEDAEKAREVLGITLTRSSKQRDHNDKPLAMAGFPYHALDTYLPKFIRAGVRVAICDQLEDPSKTQKLVKRGITEIVKPAEKE